MIVKSENVRNGHYVMNELESVIKELFSSVLEGFDVDEMVDVVLDRPSEVFDLFSEYGVIFHIFSPLTIIFLILYQILYRGTSVP